MFLHNKIKINKFKLLVRNRRIIQLNLNKIKDNKFNNTSNKTYLHKRSKIKIYRIIKHKVNSNKQNIKEIQKRQLKIIIIVVPIMKNKNIKNKQLLHLIGVLYFQHFQIRKNHKNKKFKIRLSLNRLRISRNKKRLLNNHK